jgi:hypothetical protein
MTVTIEPIFQLIWSTSGLLCVRSTTILFFRRRSVEAVHTNSFEAVPTEISHQSASSGTRIRSGNRSAFVGWERGAQCIADAVLHLCDDDIGVDSYAAIDRTDYHFNLEASIDSHAHVRDLRDKAAERFMDGDTQAMSLRLPLVPSRLFGCQPQYCCMPRMIAEQCQPNSTGCRPAACACSSIITFMTCAVWV